MTSNRDIQRLFRAYLWLIHHESPTRVGTYAYVNPVVAVVFGYFLAGEGLGLRTIPGTLSVLISVLVIATTRVKKPVPTLALTAVALGECRDCHPWTISAHRRN